MMSQRIPLMHWLRAAFQNMTYLISLHDTEWPHELITLFDRFQILNQIYPYEIPISYGFAFSFRKEKGFYIKKPFKNFHRYKILHYFVVRRMHHFLNASIVKAEITFLSRHLHAEIKVRLTILLEKCMISCISCTLIWYHIVIISSPCDAHFLLEISRDIVKYHKIV